MLKILRKHLSLRVPVLTCGYSTSKDTIFALSSGFGKSGVAVIRVCGPMASSVGTTIAGTGFKPRFAHLRKFFHPKSRELIDKGLVLWFPGPKSFSGDDSVEFQCHGGPAVVSALLDAVGTVPGCRPAEPGEFTRRAFYAGKLDLTEVEGLADLIHAETEAQRKQALIQAMGGISKLYSRWREMIIRNIAHVEAFIDFSEDENIEDNILPLVQKDMKNLREEIARHLQDARKGERTRTGIRTVIIGAPNVGKSSLVNILCQKPVSIVTDVAGTTRDIIETAFNIGGFPVLLADTAGLRNSPSDIVETEGILRARNYLETVDLILVVIDATELIKFPSLSEYVEQYNVQLGLTNELKAKTLIHVINKSDLVDDPSVLEKYSSDGLVISCLSHKGIDNAIETLSNQLKCLCGSPSFENPILSQVRHKFHLQQALDSIDEFVRVDLEENVDLAILAQKLRLAVRSIGKITGEIGVEDILDVIFRDFCIGK